MVPVRQVRTAQWPTDASSRNMAADRGCGHAGVDRSGRYDVSGGFADSGLECVRSALSQATSINHPLSVSFASGILSMVLLLRRDYLAGEALAREQIEYCRVQS